ncbi:Thiamine kinase [Vibrio aerogenes CECT 7868]|uniref:Thiamine kinase n=1 Tax=Vibrio aerogenes CECT 7868 TaxID=1216006 RepID=A0A1M5X5U9_9VIBR|nr:phosphotransferase [Vibrio aerogenes]SHH95181.1 Thiamine kinase [Vibrio aerogenes CECT 7868]
MARMSWREACLLEPSLASVSGAFKASPLIAEMLSGGLTNRCWKVEFNEHVPVVWRPSTLVTQYFSISRHQEYRILSALDTAGFSLSPKPYSLKDEGLIVEWIDGEPPDQDDEKLLVGLFVQIHQFPVKHLPVIPFSYIARLDHYWFQLQSLGFPTDTVQALYEQWRVMPNIKETSDTLCHFDLGMHNIIKTASGFKVIDWEYAALADPRLDLAMSFGTEEALAKIVTDYCYQRHISDTDDWIDGVKQWIPRARMLAMLWYFIAEIVWDSKIMGEEAKKIKRSLSDL